MSERTFTSRLAELRYSRVNALMAELNVLPTSMHVPMHILQLQRSRASKMEDFAAAISADASLTTKVLSLANSAWFSPRQPVVKVTDAVSMIGLNNLLPLLFGVSIAGLFNRADLPASERATLWRTSLFKATVARQWATRCAPELCEEAFLCALLQDIAVPIMSVADRAAALELASVLEFDPSEVRAEREASFYGADHCEFGAALARQLGLPQLFIDAVRWHHVSPLEQAWPNDLVALAPALWLAASVPHGMTRPDAILSRRLEKTFQVVRTRVAKGPEFTDFLREAGDRFTAVSGAMGDTRDASTGFKSFLQEVAAQIAGSLCGALGESARTIGDLQNAKQDLEGKMLSLADRVRDAARDADHDALTGALNRRGFLAAGQSILDGGAAQGAQCAIGFADVDNFKGVNDKYGHDVGDEALIQIAASLKMSVARLHGAVGRMGGDEFAFILSLCSSTTPSDGTLSRQEVREEIVASLAGLTVKSADGSDVPIGCSIGLFWIGTPNAGEQIEALLGRADRLMYEAKRSGKGKVVDGEVRAAA